MEIITVLVRKGTLFQISFVQIFFYKEYIKK
jgi:hypothetical protein